MDLYFLPLACSTASRIMLSELGAQVRYLQVDPATKRLEDGTDYHAVHPLGLVPALRTDGGHLITENVAVLAHLAQLAQLDGKADSKADSKTEPKLLEWLSFIATELHAKVMNPLFDRSAPPEVRQFAVQKAGPRLAMVEKALEGRAWLLDAFSAADAYLITVLNWAQATPIDLTPYPNLTRYLAAGTARPSVASVLRSELPLYLAEQKAYLRDRKLTNAGPTHETEA